jgi:hypothetical protein
MSLMKIQNDWKTLNMLLFVLRNKKQLNKFRASFLLRIRKNFGGFEQPFEWQTKLMHD